MGETNALVQLGPEVEQGRTPASVRSRLLRLLPFIVAVTIAVLYAVGSESPATPSAAVGDCFRPAEDDGVTEEKTSCRSSTADLRVVAVVASLTGGAEQCPEDTDAVLDGRELGDVGRLVCAVTLRGPHPGAPGLGGGLLRTGDCVADPGAGSPRLEEQPCGRPGQLAVLGRVAGDAACPAGTTTARTLGLLGVPRPKLCLEPRPTPRFRSDAADGTGSDSIGMATKP